MKIAEIKELKNSLIQSLTGKIEDAFDEILENHTNHILSEKMPSEPYYIIEWDGEQYCCHTSEFGKNACYGLGNSPERAMKDYHTNAVDFKQQLKQ